MFCFNDGAQLTRVLDKDYLACYDCPGCREHWNYHEGDCSSYTSAQECPYAEQHEAQGTVYVYVRGGVVQDVLVSDRFGARMNLEILDYDNDGCDCSDEGVHSHEVWELPGNAQKKGV